MAGLGADEKGELVTLPLQASQGWGCAAVCCAVLRASQMWVADSLIRLYLQPQQRVAELGCANSSFINTLMVDLTLDLTPPAPTAATAAGGAPNAATTTAAAPGNSGAGGVAVGVNAWQLRSYLGVDGDASGPRQKWLLKDAPFAADWISKDPAQNDLFAQTTTPTPAAVAAPSSAAATATAASGAAVGAPLYPGVVFGGFDMVVSFKTLSSRSCGGSGEALSTLLRNASGLLKPGGLFVGSLIDPATVWYKATKHEREWKGRPAKVERGEGVMAYGPAYRIDLPAMPKSNASFEQAFSPAYRLYIQLVDMPGCGAPSSTSSSSSSASVSQPPPPMSGLLLHVATLVGLARKHGLEVLGLQNFVDFFLEHADPLAGLDTLKHTARKLHVFAKHSPAKLTPAQMDLYSAYAPQTTRTCLQRQRYRGWRLRLLLSGSLSFHPFAFASLVRCVVQAYGPRLRFEKSPNRAQQELSAATPERPPIAGACKRTGGAT